MVLSGSGLGVRLINDEGGAEGVCVAELLFWVMVCLGETEAGVLYSRYLLLSGGRGWESCVLSGSTRRLGRDADTVTLLVEDKRRRGVEWGWCPRRAGRRDSGCVMSFCE